MLHRPLGGDYGSYMVFINNKITDFPRVVVFDFAEIVPVVKITDSGTSTVTRYARFQNRNDDELVVVLFATTSTTTLCARNIVFSRCV